MSAARGDGFRGPEPEHVGRLLDRLQGVRCSGRGWMARCPSHDDHEPSLSIAVGEDGRVLLNCFAGCPGESVLAALGMGMADLFPDAGRGAFPRRAMSSARQRLAGDAAQDEKATSGSEVIGSSRGQRSGLALEQCARAKASRFGCLRPGT